MAKDSKKMAAARSRWRMGGKKAQAAGRAKAVRRAVEEERSELEIKRRKHRQADKTGR